MKYICPAAKTCISKECGCRVPHERVKSKNHDHREWNCSIIYSTIDDRILCPACEPVDAETLLSECFKLYMKNLAEGIDKGVRNGSS